MYSRMLQNAENLNLSLIFYCSICVNSVVEVLMLVYTGVVTLFVCIKLN